ncbi:Thioredoxin domain-containing 3 [Paramuricea clavata]|uniref:Thioredoxin domain-containing 3 n=2 Tax=Paramuricea clavata TaxID=317549 RepID=A0A6S7HFQ6_PARCT|nr:Thioredoxin domain-containing 3 [Paramuricea clavata]
MKLLLVCLCALIALAFGNVVDLEFKRTAQTGSVNRFETAVLANNDDAPVKRGICGDPCQSGYKASKYCTSAAKHCFGNGQTVYIRFNPAFHTTPKVTIGLTLLDTNKYYNVRVRASVTSVTKNGFWLKFQPWDISITYQIGVNWMACQ